jgi:hypothetical protein
MVDPDNYHPLLHLNLKLTFNSQPALMTPQCSYKQGDYLLLYTTLYIFVIGHESLMKILLILQFIILLLVCLRPSTKPFHL